MAATLKKIIEVEKRDSLSELYNTHQYVEWTQKISRNIQEYNFLLSIKDTYDRSLIVTNANLFFEIQALLKTKSPYINEMTFEQLLEYVYSKRIYYDMWYDGFYFYDSTHETLPNDTEIRSFLRLHFDPTAKKLTGSSFDKVLSWIKEGWAVDSIVDALKHYFDHKKMYQSSNVLIEHLNCQDFLNLGNSTNFSIFKNSYLIFSKLNETFRKEITNDKELYGKFLEVVQNYIKNQKSRFNVQLFEIAISKIGLYKDRCSDYLIYLDNSIQGFDFDSEKNIVIHTAQTNKNITIIALENDFFIYKIVGFETLKMFSSPHWCINRNSEQFERYITPADDFYVVLQRYPRSQFNYKSGITFTRKTGVIKHSFNYADRPNTELAEKYVSYFQPASFLEKLSNILNFRKKKFDVDDDADAELAMAMDEGPPLEGDEEFGTPMILPRY